MNRFRLIIVVLVVAAGFTAGIIIAPKARPLTVLPAPTFSTSLAYSGPMIIPLLSNKPVLGAQAIDPVEFVADINKERAKAGAKPLTLNTTLMRAAKLRVDVMKNHQNFSHFDPYEHIELATVLPKLNYHFYYAAENIGMGGLSAADFVAGFMNSTHHREALLDPRFTETGAAITDGPYGQYYVNYAVQLFAIPAGKNETLGYTVADKILYQRSLDAVNSDLNPLLWVVSRAVGNPYYTDAFYKKLTRQQQILQTIVPVMEQSRPFTNADVALILEYNSLVSS